MADVSESIGDPGRRWRRMVRVGAVLCTLATIMPCEGPNLSTSVWGYRMTVFEIEEGMTLSITIFNSLIFTILLGGPVLLLSTPPNYFVKRIRRIAARVLFVVLWALSTFLPYCAAIRLIQVCHLNDAGIALSMMGLSVYLLISALALLSSRHVWNTPLFPFAMGTLPVALLCVAWTSAVVGWINEMLAYGVPSIPFNIIVLDGMGVIGSVLLLIGWLRWWSSVRAALRAKKSPAPATTVVPEPMQS